MYTFSVNGTRAQFEYARLKPSILARALRWVSSPSRFALLTTSWDNALINFDQKSWFPAGNYVVMKLWRESFAPNLLAVE